MSSRFDFDIAIVGAGPTGLCFALALAGSGLRIVLVEQQDESRLAEPADDGREIALTHASQRILVELGVWQRIPATAISPLRDAKVLNGRSPFALKIEADSSGRSQLGFLVANQAIRRAAYAALRETSAAALRCATRVDAVSSDAAAAYLRLADGSELRVALLVAADSRYSETRRSMGIAASMHDFGRSMLVCRMAHDRPNEQLAWEWFDHGQTLAVLPLESNLSSIVVTLPHRDVQTLLALDEDGFSREMTQRFQDRLGTMALLGGRHAYPLVAVYPRRFIAQRFALIGDAAVGMHPVTAHGFNFGLAGQESLARLIRAACSIATDIGDPLLLHAYERAHRRATRPLYLATNAIASLFSRESFAARVLRRSALRIAQGFVPFRRRLARVLADDR